MKALITTASLALILVFSGVARSQTSALRPTTGKFRDCTVDPSSCTPSDACNPKTECPSPINCRAKFSASDCGKRVKGFLGGSIKFGDPTCQARLAANRAACERDQTRAAEDCRIQRETERTDCLARHSTGRDACEKALKSEGQQCLARKSRESGAARSRCRERT
jgi:hypothetical protein